MESIEHHGVTDDAGEVAIAARRVQRLYPRVWHACHTLHGGRRSRLTDRESTVLSHLDDGVGVRPQELARHLGIVASTLSEAVEGLTRRGLITRERDPADRRRITLRLTEDGRALLDDASPLDRDRLRAALARLSPAQRRRVVEGLDLLARACGAELVARRALEVPS